MSDLPAGWIKTTFGEVTKIIGGGTPSSTNPANFTTEGGTPWITPSDLSGYKAIYISRGARNLTEKGLRESSAKIFPAGSVLFSSRAPVGYVAIAANDLSTNQGFKSFVLPDELDSKFIYFYLRHIKPVAEMMATGTTFKELSGSNAAKLPLILAPLNEQKRIAEKLDSLLARVDSCQRHLERVPQTLKRFRQSVLAAATSGRLTEEWREERGVNGEWENTDVQSVAFVGTGSTPLRSNSNFYASKGTPWVTSAATGQTFIHGAKEYVTKEAIKAHRLKLFPIGTVIVAMYGEGKTRGQVSELAIEATINQACAAIVVDETKVSKKYLKLALQANYLEMREMAEGGNQPNLNLSKIKEFTFPLPSPDEQAEIVRRVEKLFAVAAKLEARYQSASERLERLTPSLLAKGFRGELVGQAVEDESVSALVERIGKTRKEAEPDTKAKRWKRG